MNVLGGKRSWALLRGHVLEELVEIPDAVVQTVVTSPPYWGLRDYSRCACAMKGSWEGKGHNYGLQFEHESDQGGSFRETEPDPDCPKCRGMGKDDSLNVVWGGEDCEHRWGEEMSREVGRNDSKDRGQIDAKARDPSYDYERQDQRKSSASQGSFCSLCPAWRGQLGLEPTPELYVQHIVEVFREIRRVLRDDGTLWLNMGDCYTSGNREGHGTRVGAKQGTNRGSPKDAWRPPQPPALKPKDLVGMPWRVAFALQADGWWLRSDIIWAKPNPMPESVTDRPTRSHEYIFLLTKQGGPFWWVHRDTRERTTTHPKPDYRWVDEETGEETDQEPMEWDEAQRWDRINLWAGHSYFYDADAVREEGKPESEGRYDYAFTPAPEGVELSRKRPAGMREFSRGRNRRSVWDIATQPYPEAHFATFPEKLVEPCIKAGTPEKGSCSVCGSPWERVVEKPDMSQRPTRRVDKREKEETRGGVLRHWGTPKSAGQAYQNWRDANPDRTTGFRPTCDHSPATSTPALVLDPFCGSGTAGVVAIANGRRFIGIDVKAEYLSMAESRLRRFPARLDTFS